MIPITYALIGFGLSSLVGAVLMILFKAAYDRTAENVWNSLAQIAANG